MPSTDFSDAGNIQTGLEDTTHRSYLITKPRLIASYTSTPTRTRTRTRRKQTSSNLVKPRQTSSNLVDNIDHYPNLSSWKNVSTGDETIKIKRIPRTACRKLPHKTLTPTEQKRITNYLLKKGKEECKLVITPNAWLSCFGADLKREAAVINKLIITKVRETEAQCRAKRTRPVLGAKGLREQNFRKEYISTKFGTKMICLAADPLLRMEFIPWAKNLFAQRNTKANKHPPGLFAPGGHITCNLNPAFVPVIGMMLCR